MLKVILLRHGETQWNADNNRYCGRTDVELTEKGLSQAEQTRKVLEGISFNGCYSSPLKRAYQTASIASGCEVTKDERIIEVDFGLWEGKTKEEFIAEDPAVWDNWISNPGEAKAGGIGETGVEVVERVDAFFSSLLKMHKEGTVLVVAHNGVNRLYLAYKLGMRLKNYRQLIQHNSTITSFTLDSAGSLTLEMLNSKNF